MPLLLADFIYSRDCKLNLRKNVDTTLTPSNDIWRILIVEVLCAAIQLIFRGDEHEDS